MAVEETKQAAKALTDKAGTIAKWGIVVAFAAAAYAWGPAIAFKEAGLVVAKTAKVIGTGLSEGGTHMINAIGTPTPAA